MTEVMEKLSQEDIEAQEGYTASEGHYRRLIRRYASNKLAVVALFVFILIALIGISAPLIAPHSFTEIDMTNRLASPTATHWLGTDELGRDTLTRLIFASRTSLTASLLAVSVAVGIGLPFGLIAGYFGSWVDRLLSRIADALMCFPYLLLAMAVIAALGPGLRNAMTAIGLIFAPRLFRLVRASVMTIRNATFIEAAIASGTTTPRILVRHILPNISSPLIVQVTVMLAAALLAEAGLSFLGLGVMPPDSSWGLMLGRAFQYIRSAPLGTYWPGLAIALTTLSLNLIGDGLRDALGSEKIHPTRKARREAAK